jgi:hypothetical protein
VTHVHTQSNRVCNSRVILLWLMFPKDQFISRFLYFTTAGVKCHLAAVKGCPVPHFSIVIFFWSFGIIDASTIKCWELSTAQAGARGVRDVARIHYPSCTDSIKPNLQFCCNFVVINASEGSLCFQIFVDFQKYLKSTTSVHIFYSEVFSKDVSYLLIKMIKDSKGL